MYPPLSPLWGPVRGSMRKGRGPGGSHTKALWGPVTVTVTVTFPLTLLLHTPSLTSRATHLLACTRMPWVVQAPSRTLSSTPQSTHFNAVAHTLAQAGAVGEGGRWHLGGRGPHCLLHRFGSADDPAAPAGGWGKGDRLDVHGQGKEPQ